MATPSGTITVRDINRELQRDLGAAFSINGTAERALAGKSSGAISFNDFKGKSFSDGGRTINWTSGSTLGQYESYLSVVHIMSDGRVRLNQTLPAQSGPPTTRVTYPGRWTSSSAADTTECMWELLGSNGKEPNSGNSKGVWRRISTTETSVGYSGTNSDGGVNAGVLFRFRRPLSGGGYISLGSQNIVIRG